MMERAYLDYNATAPLREHARAAMLRAMDVVGNPSSVHAEGRAARQLIEVARRHVASLVNAPAKQVVFTSGATEALRTALSSLVADLNHTGRNVTKGAEAAPCTVVASGIEHTAVLDNAPQGVIRVDAQPSGAVDVEALAARVRALRKAGPVMVALMLANNETGVIQDIAGLRRALCEARDEDGTAIAAPDGGAHARLDDPTSDWPVALVCDAVQAPGRVPVDFAALGCDALVLSAHKFGGPKGVGALVLGPDRLPLREALLAGGQEQRQRGGTENVIGIAGMGAAAESAGEDLSTGTPAQLAEMRDRLEQGLLKVCPDVVIAGADASERLANTTCVMTPGLDASTALIAMDLSGVAVSTGAACSSGKVAPSHVLQSMGMAPDLIGSAIRISSGHGTRMSDVDKALSAYENATKGSRLRPQRAA